MRNLVDNARALQQRILTAGDIHLRGHVANRLSAIVNAADVRYLDVRKINDASSIGADMVVVTDAVIIDGHIRGVSVTGASDDKDGEVTFTVRRLVDVRTFTVAGANEGWATSNLNDEPAPSVDSYTITFVDGATISLPMSNRQRYKAIDAVKVIMTAAGLSP